MKTFAVFLLSALLLAIQATANVCTFCKVDVIQNQSVFENNHWNVLLDFAPRVPGHLLVIPKRHVLRADELSQEEWMELSDAILKITKAFSELLSTKNYIILEKNGCDAFQEVPHIHFHLLPVHSESWADIFNTDPECLSKEDLRLQVDLFRRSFDM